MDAVVKARPPQLLLPTGLRILPSPKDDIASSGLSHPLFASSRTFTFYQWSTSFPPPTTVLVTATVLYAGDVHGFHQSFLRSTSFAPPDIIPVTVMVLHAGDVQGFDQP
ncbi:hypothetical protein KP509_21G077900 [Ceratopteris richardii]|uniref:Uncharacterized protein n=1 Tax=Ceratopteris richardii TaxID=49495 RepID=A0A8T2SDH1_CERRI|nr:hypothetical protein KP509_21G077900 [Ceratopteris richardii]